MDKILEAVMLSTYPINVKQGLARRVIEAAKQPMDSAQCWAMLELSTKLFLVGDTKFKREIGQEVLEVYGQYHLEAFVEFFNAHFLLTLLQEGYGTPGHPSPYVLDYVQLGLQFIPEGPPAEGVFALLRLEVLRKVCERPSPRQCAKVARLLSQYPRCIPDGRHRLLFCQQLVRCIGQFQCLAEGDEGIVEFLNHVNRVSGLLPKIWKAQASSILPSLKELFAIISSTEEQEPPSNALASVVQYVPLELMDGVIRNLTNDDSISDAQMMTAISRMIDWVSWPLGKNIDKWIITLLKGLAAVKKFSILIEVSLSKIEKVFSKLLYPIVREAALSVLKYMLLSFQHSHEAFHLLLPHIPKMVASLAEEDSNSRANCLEELAELIHCMVFRFSGFPDLYEPVMEAIKDLHVPNEDRIKQLLGQNAWTSQKNELVCFYPRLAAKSDTGKIGLINLGNTCYMNSVIQALFMASDFRHCVLHLPEDNSQPLMTKLQWLFAFLEHSQRPAVSPESFLSASWTPWFSPGAQQDCSEYLKYLLDRLHEEEKTGKRICQKLKQSNTPSPPEEQPSPNSSPSPSPTAVEKMFGGKIVTRIRCLRCLNVSTREEAFTDLSLAFPPPDRRRRRLGSVMLPMEDVRVQGPPSPAKTQAPGTEGARRQRKHCIAGDALPPVVSIEILGFQEPGGHRGNFRQEDEKEKKEKEGNNDKEKEEKEEGKEKAQKKEKEEEKEKKQEEEEEKMEEREKKEENEDKKDQKEKEKKKEEEEKEEKIEKKKEKKAEEEEKEKEEKRKEGEGCLGLRTGGNQGVAFGEQMCGPEGSRSVPDLLNYFLSPETLTAENRYHCEHCASLQDAEKVVELSEGPRYLILTLLRFSFDLRTMRRKKILDNVSIPLFLRLPMAGGCPQQDQGQACAAYDLCSVVVHSGISSESGHYYCYAREGATAVVNPPGTAGLSAAEKPPGLESQWYLFNDTRVSFSSFESVSNVTSFFPKDTAYVLFYRQRVREGWKAEPKSPRPHTEPALHKDLIEAISKDNILYLQEQEKEARSRSAYISTLPKSPPWGRDFDEDKDEDDEGSPGGCDPAAGGSGSSFHRLVF
ncbi:ubiquitin carboxyl-terminal hydrolase 35 [Antechinus flavipes]|uniref:ubiquitin carboxyl-terminal hydrolase 35 n=1 Tax=Antechinus flavipes TaxID=38775 RepID=UPI0022368312|nr:ubiquitin carboxyl-terminal hydrolase 35 [Antechinus flavipes]